MDFGPEGGVDSAWIVGRRETGLKNFCGCSFRDCVLSSRTERPSENALSEGKGRMNNQFWAENCNWAFCASAVARDWGTARGVMLEMVSMEPHALRDAAEELKGDREIVLAAVSQSGFALRHATEELKGDREIVMTAVSQDGSALEHAAEELKGDREIVTAAVSKNGWSLDHATKDLKEDAEMLNCALEGPQNHYQVVGLKVALLSGRCCSEVFCNIALRALGKEMVLRRCAASLDLDPDYVRSSAAS